MTEGAQGSSAKGNSSSTEPKATLTPSTPLNLPAVLQDRPRVRHPPPVPPRSPRGGHRPSQGGSSAVRGGLIEHSPL